MINYYYELLTNLSEVKLHEILNFIKTYSYGYNRTTEDNFSEKYIKLLLDTYRLRDNSYLITAYDNENLVGTAFFLDSTYSTGINNSVNSSVIKEYFVSNAINQSECFSISYVRVHKEYAGTEIAERLFDHAKKIAIENGFKNLLIFALECESVLSFYQNYFGEKLVITDVADPTNIINSKVITKNLMIVRDVV